jgi:hypothetical protein
LILPCGDATTFWYVYNMRGNNERGHKLIDNVNRYF